jgi:hypothetical protein
VAAPDSGHILGWYHLQARFCRGSLYLGESHGRTFARKPPKSGQHAIWRITFVSVSCLKDVANSILFIAQNCFRRLFRQSCDLDSLLPANQPLIQIPFGELLQEYFKQYTRRPHPAFRFWITSLHLDSFFLSSSFPYHPLVLVHSYIFVLRSLNHDLHQPNLAITSFHFCQSHVADQSD